MLSKELIEVYKVEGLAEEAFKEYRLKKGIVCKKCGCQHHYWLASKFQFQCRTCRFRTTLRSGSVLEGSKLPYSYFFIAMHLLMKYGNTLRIEEFQRQTGHKYYDPLWDFLRKIKNYLKENDQSPVLIDFMEIVNQHFIKNKGIVQQEEKVYEYEL
jgi:hypothetical protein